jgi:hypothetical protein
MTPRLLLCTRFGIGVKDPAWFEHRFPLMEAITIPSLARQTRTDFDWRVFVDPDLDPAVRARLEQAIAPVAGARIVDRHAHTGKGLVTLGRELGVRNSDWILTGRIDDDDAWARDTVEQVYAKAEAWLAAEGRGEGLALTFPRGLEWLMYDLVDVDKLLLDRRMIRRQAVRPYPYAFHSMSVFVLAPFEAKFFAISASHSKMAERAAAQGYDVVEAEAGREMWLYARHKQALSSFHKAREPERPIDLDEFERVFGIDAARAAAYIESESDHGYLVEKRADDRRNALARRIGEIDEAMARADVMQRESLAIERAAAEAEIERLSRSIVGELKL